MTSLLVATSLTAGCAEDPELDTTVEQPALTYEVVPRLELVGDPVQHNVRMDTFFLGVGAVILEPLDDPDAPLVSNRTPTVLGYIGTDEDSGLAYAAPLEIPETGRYMVTLAVQPVAGPVYREPGEANEIAGGGSDSVSISGVYFTVGDPSFPVMPCDGECSPEPVPWRQRMMMVAKTPFEGGYEFGRVDEVPFNYSSSRTGYVRLGEVTIDASTTELQVSIDIAAWLDEALAPAVAEIVAIGGDSTGGDLNSRLETSGYGLERIFTLARASVD